MDKLIFIGSCAGALLAIVGFGAWLAKVITRATKPISNLNSAMKSSLKHSIARAYRDYMSSQKIERFALQCVIEMYDEHKKLGGNGFVESLINELKQLPIDTSESSRKE